MKVIIESWNKKFNQFVPQVKRTTLKLGRFLGQKNKQVEIYLVPGSFMQKNVLSFPAPKGFPRPDIKRGTALGEIYLNPDYIAKEPLKIENWKLKIPAELAHMLIHGFLHLLGYDHKKKNDRIIMEKREQELLKKL